MREIKFRGKDKSTNQWVYGYFVGVSGDDVVIIPTGQVNYDLGCIGASNSCDCHKRSFGQFTGQYDCKGNEIYTCDVIQSYDSEGKPILHYIVWNDAEACFGAVDIKYHTLSCLNSYWIEEFEKEVVGNMYDNHEYLKMLNKEWYERLELEQANNNTKI